MKTFEYVAIDLDGNAVVGRAWASNEVELDRELERDGVTLTSAQEVGGARKRGKHKLKPRALHQVTTQLATVTGAGIPIVEGLEGIQERMQDTATRELLSEMVADLQAGEPLSEVMERHPKAFPKVYRSSVEAGEASGALDEVLMRLAHYLEWSQSMRATTIQALIYPAILMFAITGLIGILLYFVLPRIVKLFPGGRDELPSETQLVMGMSDFMVAHIFEILGVIVACAVAVFIALRREGGRQFLHGCVLSLPKFGSVLGQISTSKFASTARTLQTAGCDVFTVLRIAGNACGNASLSASFARATEHVRNGSTIADALEREKHVDPLLTQMVSVGEKSGQLDQCLARLVEYYDEEVPRVVKRFLSFLEPAMLLGAGIVVTFILLAALMPIFKLYESM